MALFRRHPRATFSPAHHLHFNATCHWRKRKKNSTTSIKNVKWINQRNKVKWIFHHFANKTSTSIAYQYFFYQVHLLNFFFVFRQKFLLHVGYSHLMDVIDWLVRKLSIISNWEINRQIETCVWIGRRVLEVWTNWEFKFEQHLLKLLSFDSINVL